MKITVVGFVIVLVVVLALILVASAIANGRNAMGQSNEQPQPPAQ